MGTFPLAGAGRHRDRPLRNELHRRRLAVVLGVSMLVATLAACGQSSTRGTSSASVGHPSTTIDRTASNTILPRRGVTARSPVGTLAQVCRDAMNDTTLWAGLRADEKTGAPSWLRDEEPRYDAALRQDGDLYLELLPRADPVVAGDLKTWEEELVTEPGESREAQLSAIVSALLGIDDECDNRAGEAGPRVVPLPAWLAGMTATEATQRLSENGFRVGTGVATTAECVDYSQGQVATWRPHVAVLPEGSTVTIEVCPASS